jgi:hypothetical protein
MANANIPGTSNHGYGLALDLAIGTPQAFTSLTIPDTLWLISRAPDFGFFGENAAEGWHWVLHPDHLPKPPPEPSQEDDDMFRLIRPAGFYDIALLGGVVIADELDEHGVSKRTLTDDIVNDLVDANLVIGMQKGDRKYDEKAQVLQPGTWAAIVGRPPVGERPAGEV